MEIAVDCKSLLAPCSLLLAPCFFLTSPLHDVRLVVISQEPISLLPSWQQSRISIAREVGDVFDKWTLIKTLTDLQRITGPFHRLLGATEQLQVPMAEARLAVGVPGMNTETALNFRDKARMKMLFNENGIPCAKHALTHDLESAFEFIRKCPYPVQVRRRPTESLMMKKWWLPFPHSDMR